MAITKTKEKEVEVLVDDTFKKKTKSKKGKKKNLIKEIKKYAIICGIVAVLVLGTVLFIKLYNGEEKAD